jgi:hypothetical protein
MNKWSTGIKGGVARDEMLNTNSNFELNRD